MERTRRAMWDSAAKGFDGQEIPENVRNVQKLGIYCKITPILPKRTKKPKMRMGQKPWINTIHYEKPWVNTMGKKILDNPINTL